jgi:hypothetical protein
MNKDQAMKFLTAVNRAQAHLPPMIWEPIADSDVVRMVLTIANGVATCEFKPAAIESDRESRAPDRGLIDGR